MEENYRFPLFVDLRGRSAVIVGGGKIALRRAEVLTRFGAAVTMIAPACAGVPEGVTWLEREYRPGDLEHAFLAVAATNDRDVNFRVGEEARALGIFASIADCAAESSFFFPAICTGSGLVAGVVSRGDAHSRTAEAAQKIRGVLEELT